MNAARRIASLAIILLPAAAAAQRADDGLARLQRELVRLSAIAGGKVGVGIIHLESGRELYVNADEPYPMASTIKCRSPCSCSPAWTAGPCAWTR